MNPVSLKIKERPSDVFNRGKTNQKSCKEISWNESSDFFWDPVANGFHVGVEKREKRNGKQVPGLFLANHFIGSLRKDTLGHSYSVFN